MKKTKLLSSLMTLALAFSVGACGETTIEEVETGEEEDFDSSTETILTSEDTSSETSESENTDESSDIDVSQEEGSGVDKASSLAGLIKNIESTNNFTLNFTFDGYVSSKTTTYLAVMLGTYDQDELFNSLEYYGSYYNILLSYTDDALLIEYSYGESKLAEQLFINTRVYDGVSKIVRVMMEFDYADGEWSYIDTYSGSWKDNFCTLCDASSYELDQASAYNFTRTSTNSNGDTYGLYSITNFYNACYFVDMLGAADFWYGESSLEIAWFVWMYGIYFYPDLQEMYADIGIGSFGSIDYSNYHLIEDRFLVSVSDVGTTTIDENLIDSCLALV